jgi:hypothetical protein
LFNPERLGVSKNSANDLNVIYDSLPTAYCPLLSCLATSAILFTPS